MTRFHFLSPGDHRSGKMVLTKICDMLRTDKAIDICVAYFTHLDIAEEIIERAKLQKPTRLLLNLADLLRPVGPHSSEFRASAALVKIFDFLDGLRFPDSEHIQMKTLGREQNRMTNMHHKFIIGDREIGFGSMNFTTNSMTNNYENFCFTNKELFYQSFEVQFAKMWHTGEELVAPRGELRVIECPECGQSAGVDFESYGMICTYYSHKFAVIS